MKTSLDRLALFAFAPLAALWVFAQTAADSPDREHVIPLVADGEGFRSQLFVGNASGGVNQCSMELVGAGLDMARFGDHATVAPDGAFATIDLGAPDTVVSLASLGVGVFATGYAKLSCAGPAVARLLLTSEAGGASVSLATVESAPSGADFALPAPPGPGSLGLALANDGRVTASCAVALQDRYATTVAEGVWRIPPRSSDIRFLDDVLRVPAGFPGGSVAVSCDPGVHALGRPAGGVLFSAPPAVSRPDDAVSPRAGMASGVLTAAATGDDFGDDRFSAEPVEIPSTTAGRLDAGDVDYFRVEIGSPGTLTVETRGSVDTYGYLENENGRPLRFNNDGGEGLNFRIETGKAGDRLPALSAGVYYVHVRGIGGGPYELVVSGTAQGPGALPAAAAPTVSIDAVPAGDENTAVQLTATLTGGTYDGTPDYAWSVSGGALNDSTLAAPTWTRPSVSADGDYTVSLVVTVHGAGTNAQNGGSATANASRTAQVRDVPAQLPPAAAPTVSIDAVPAGDENTGVTLGATLTGGAYDGSPEYAWSVSGGALNDSTLAAPTWTRPSVSADGDYTVSLVVTVHGAGTNAQNGGSATANASRTAQVRDVPAQLPPAAAPTVSIDAVPAGDENTGVTLGATLTGGAYDGSPEYAWSVSGGALNDSTLAAPTWTRPSVSADGDYTVSLVVTVHGAGTNAQNGGSATANASRTAQVRDTATTPPPATSCVDDAKWDAVAEYYDANKNRNPNYGANWYRVLIAYRVEDPERTLPAWAGATARPTTAFTATEATSQENVWSGWTPVREVLECLEAAPATPTTLPAAAAPSISINAVPAGDENTSVTLGATLSGGTYDGTPEYAWSVSGGALNDSTLAAPTWTRPAVSADGDYTVSLVVTVRGAGTNAQNGGSATANASRDARVRDVPAQLPAAAAPTVTINAIPAGDENTGVQLSATLSGGAYDGAVEYDWDVSGGALNDDASATPTWTRPSVTSNTDVTVSLTITARGAGTVARNGTSDTANAADRTAPVRDAGGGGNGGDHGDDRASATPVGIPSTTSGNLTRGDRDYFRIDITRAGSLTLATTGSTDTYGILYDDGGGELQRNDDGGAGHNFRIARGSISAGTYYLLVRGYYQSSTEGDYTLSLTGSARGGGTALPAAAAPTVAIDAVPAGDEDTTVTLGATLTGGTYDGTPEYAWSVTGGALDDDASPTPTWTRPAVTSNTNHTVSLTVTAHGAGTVARNGTSATADAADRTAQVLDVPVQLPVATAPTVTIDAVAAGDENTSVTLGATLAGGTYDGAVEYDWDVSGGALNDDTSATPTWTRPAVASNTNHTVSLTVTAHGAGTVARNGTSATANAADRTAQVRDTGGDHGDDRASATPVEIPSTTSGNITFGDRDYFRIDVTRAGSLTLTTTGSTDTYGVLYDNNGTQLRANDDSGQNYNFRIAVGSVSVGAYYVMVRGFGGSTRGDYSLSVTGSALSGTPPANAPTVTINPVAAGDEETAVALGASLTGGAYDGTPEYGWSVSGGALDDPASATPTWTRPAVTGDTGHTVFLTLTVHGAGANAQTGTSASTSANRAAQVLETSPPLPVAAAPAVTIDAIPAGDEGTQAQLGATLTGGTYDGALEYAWQVTGGALSDPASTAPTWTRPAVNSDTNHTVSLAITARGDGTTARNGTSDTANASRQALVRNAAVQLPPPTAPQVSIDAIPLGTEETGVRLRATLTGGNYDGAAEYEWGVTGGTLDDVTSATPKWTRPAVNSDTDHTVSLTVTVRGAGAKARDNSQATATASRTARVRDTGADHGDSRASATQVAIPSITAGSFSSSSDVDYFRIDVRRAGTLVLETTGVQDTIGALFASDGRRLTSNYNSGAETNFRITRPSVSAGVYYLRVSAQSIQGDGAYSLSVTGAANDDDGAGAPLATIDSIDPGDAGADVNLSATLTGGNYDGAPEYAWSVSGGALDNPASATPTWTRPAVTANVDATVSLTVTVGGTGGNAPSGSSDSYSATRTAFVRAPNGDHGNTLQQAWPVTDDSTTSGTITSRDLDYFRFSLAAEKRMLIETTGSIDTAGWLFDRNGRTIVNNDDAGEGSNFRIVRTLEAGTYYVAVRGYRPWTAGPYDLVVEEYSNSAPTVVANKAPGTKHLIAGGAPWVWRNPTDAFSDRDGEHVWLEPSSSNENVATVALEGLTLVVYPHAAGTATVTVTGRDAEGASAAVSFTVTVSAPATATPSAAFNSAGDTLTLSFSDSFAAGETRAYQAWVRETSYRPNWRTFCVTSTHAGTTAQTKNVSLDLPLGAYAEPGVEYEAIYGHIGNSCQQSLSLQLSAAVKATTPGTNSFDIDVVYIGSIDAAHRAIVEEAVEKWEEIITASLPNVDFTNDVRAAGTCMSGAPALNDVVDDLRLYVKVQNRDGVGGNLASAGACLLRGRSLMPIVGTVNIDAADMARLSAERAKGLMIHEIAHALGFSGRFWGPASLLRQRSLLENGEDAYTPSDTHFAGPLARAAFDAAGGSSYAQNKVPVENSRGGAGSQDSHWRESVMDNELMTGFLDAGDNPLSAISIQAMADLGYQVDVSQADPYRLPGSGGDGLRSDSARQGISDSDSHGHHDEQPIDIVLQDTEVYEESGEVIVLPAGSARTAPAGSQ